MNKQVSQEFLAPLAVGAIATVGAALATKLVEKIAADGGNAAIEKAKDVLRASQSKDLISFTQSARLEPILLMDQRALAVPFIQDVVNSCFNLYTGYWLLAVSLDTTINGVSVGRRLDKFATDRDLNEATLNYITSNESLSDNFGLPFAKTVIQENFESWKASQEANPLFSGQGTTSGQGEEPGIHFGQGSGANKPTASAPKSSGAQSNEEEEEEKRSTRQIAEKQVAQDIVAQATNMAVGKIIEVNIEEDGKKAKVPVMIRMRVASMNPKAIVQTLAVGGVDMSFRGRWRAWRAGELRFWADFIMAMDRVDAHRAASMNDETGYYKTVYNRAAKNTMAEILNQGPSLGTASSVIVITEQSAAELERTVGGKLSSFKVRQGIFGHTYSMLMAVVDPDWESVTIYTRGIDMPTKLRAKDMKAAGKSDSSELMDILKSYQLGRAPGRI